MHQSLHHLTGLILVRTRMVNLYGGLSTKFLVPVYTMYRTKMAHICNPTKTKNILAQPPNQEAHCTTLIILYSKVHLN